MKRIVAMAAGVLCLAATAAVGQILPPPPVPPQILGINPAICSTAGGCPVVITGLRFATDAAGIYILVDGVVVTTTCVTTATGACFTAPAHATGAVNARVKNVTSGLSSPAVTFTYTAPPPAAIVNVPTLSWWGKIILIVIIILAAFAIGRRIP